MTLYEHVLTVLDEEPEDQDLNVTAESLVTAVTEWLRSEDVKKAIYEAQAATGVGPPLIAITEALVHLAQEEP